MTDLVSVIIPCYNQAKYLPEAVNSVIAQTYPCWQCIIVNDGSSDNTKEVASTLVAKDSRIRYIEQNNRGLSGARNRGLDEAAGTFVQFLDADDIILPEKLKRQVEAASGAESSTIVIGSYRYEYTDGVEQGPIEPALLCHFRSSDPVGELIVGWEAALSIPCHAMLFSTQLFKRTGIRFDERLPNHEDWHCWLRLLMLHPQPHIIQLDNADAVYRVHSGGMTQNRNSMVTGFIAAIDSALKDVGWFSREGTLLRRKRRQVLRVHGLPTLAVRTRDLVGRFSPRWLVQLVSKCGI